MANIYLNPFAGGCGTSQLLMPTQQIIRSGSGTYVPTVNTRLPLYICVELYGGGAGGAGSSQGVDMGFGGDGGDSSFAAGQLIARGGHGATFDAGLGGTCTVTLSAPGFSFTGQSGATAIAQEYDAGFGSSPYRITQDFFPGGVGGNGYFPGAGMERSNPSAVPNTGSGGAGGHINANTSNGLLVNAGCGGGAGGYLRYLLPPTNPDGSNYDYELGIAGTAGTAGTRGNAGGAGGSSLLIITEFYQ